jgi:hypothetical protein
MGMQDATQLLSLCRSTVSILAYTDIRRLYVVHLPNRFLRRSMDAAIGCVGRHFDDLMGQFGHFRCRRGLQVNFSGEPQCQARAVCHYGREYERKSE